MTWNLNSNYACNTETLKYLRSKLGITQIELACRAGYSERLVRKAESGSPIAARTIVDLATALSTTDQTIYPEDLVSDPKAIAKLYNKMVYEHQADVMSVMQSHFDEEITFVVHGDPEDIPFAGTHRGIPALDRFFGIFFDFLEVPPGHDPEPHYHFVSEGTDVVIWGLSYMRPKDRPMNRPMPVSNLMKFRRGKIYHFEDHLDTRYAASLLTGDIDPAP